MKTKLNKSWKFLWLPAYALLITSIFTPIASNNSLDKRLSLNQTDIKSNNSLLTTKSYNDANKNQTSNTSVQASDIFNGYTGDVTLDCTTEGTNLTIVSASGSINAEGIALTMVSDWSGYSITGIGDNAFNINQGRAIVCNSLTLPNSLETIGDGAFWENSSINSITLPDSLTSIGKNAFRDCSGLTEIMLKESLSSIGEYAFLGCEKLSAIHYPNERTTGTGITTDTWGTGSTKWVARSFWDTNNQLIGRMIEEENTPYAQVGCLAIGQLDLSALSSIPDNAFYRCCNVVRVTFSSSLKSIGSNAFDRCGLTSLTLPMSLETIGSAAFTQTNITSVALPEGFTNIGKNAFQSCRKLTSVTFPNSLTSISDYAFDSCSLLANVTFGNELKTIGEGVFSSCNSLTTLTFPNTLTSIGVMAFGYCQDVNSVSFNEGLNDIGASAFSSCIKLSNIVFPDGLTSIGNGAFSSCSMLESISIPNSLSTIGSEVFSGCTKVTTIDLTRCTTKPTWDNGVFLGFSDTANYIIPYTASPEDWYESIDAWSTSTTHKYMYDDAGYWADNVTNGDFQVQILDGEGRTELTGVSNDFSAENLVFKNGSFSTIGENVFKNNANISGVLTIPSTITSIGANAFASCNNLTTIDLTSYTDGIPDFANNCFANCSADFIIPYTSNPAGWYQAIENWTNNSANNKYMDDSAQNWATNVTDGKFKVQILDSTGRTKLIEASSNFSATNLTFKSGGLSAIAENIFKDNTNISGILTIPSTINSIGANAFSGCNNITTIDLTSYKDTIPSFSNGCFGGDDVEFDLPYTTDFASWYQSINNWTNQATTGKYMYDNAQYWADNVIKGDFKVQILDSVGAITTLVGVSSDFSAENLNFKSGYFSTISENVFANNTNISGSLTIPNTISCIGANAFANCNNLTNIDLTSYTSGVPQFTSDCFANDTAEFDTPYTRDIATLMSWYEAIKNWTDLTINPKMCIEGDATDWGQGITNGQCKVQVNDSTCTTFTLIDASNIIADKLVLNSNITALSDGALQNNLNLKDAVNLPTSITKIGANVFNGCNNVNEIHLNWTDLTCINGMNINRAWLGDLNNSNTTILVPVGMVDAYQAVATAWGMDQCNITDGTTPTDNTLNLGIALGVSLGTCLGIPGIIGLCFLIGYKVKKQKQNQQE